MPGYGARYWEDRTARARRRSYPKCRGDQKADVVVIGGGLTGCAAAYALADAGLDVVLVEAERLACGATAGGIGAVVPEPPVSFLAAEKDAGRRAARAAWQAAHRGSVELASVLRKLSIRCDLAPSHLLVNADSPDAAVALRRELTARRGAGLAAAWLNAGAVRDDAALDSRGALRVRDAFVFDPVRAALGMAAAAASAGARIFEASPVRRTRFTRKDATVVLATGTVTTRGVVVATGEPGAVFGQLRRHVRREAGYAVVTSPLTAAMRRETGRHAAIVAERGAGAHWLRWLPDDRALFAGALSRPVGLRLRNKALVQRTAQLMYELSVRYPVISGLPAEWGWDLPVVSTPDGLPWIGPHRNFPFHFFAIAFGWQGDGLSFAAARAAARYFRNESQRDDEALGFVRYL